MRYIFTKLANTIITIQRYGNPDRNGAWCFYPNMLKVSNRYGADPTLRSGFAGFTVVAVDESDTE